MAGRALSGTFEVGGHECSFIRQGVLAQRPVGLARSWSRRPLHVLIHGGRG